ncbi:hypothetical protein OEA41_007020 [Lepraria neglecta]|uniref:Uncharacterized protein n=1 Tax=Lepraria neglecta TaxID=209136 RepID=A0AAD9Z9T7_9LECA|nr:hypothetical protein OEA41_007020 [Lepraria neglecta]
MAFARLRQSRKKEASKEPEMSYRKFVGGVEVVNLKAAGGSKLRNTSPASVQKATPRTLDSIEKATTRFDEGNARPVEQGSDAVEKVKVAKIDRNSEEDDLEDGEILVVDPNEIKVQPSREQRKVKEKKTGNVALNEDALSSDDEEEDRENGEGLFSWRKMKSFQGRAQKQARESAKQMQWKASRVHQIPAALQSS